jgi:hypothetical protein
VFAMVNVPLVYFAVKLADKLGQVSSHPQAKVVMQLTGAMRGTYWLAVLTFVLLYVAVLLVRTSTIATDRRARELRGRALDAGVLEA